MILEARGLTNKKNILLSALPSTHTIMAVFAVALTFLPVALADPHPTLPTMWRATTKEDEVGVVFESENFADDHEITENNPDAKWTNYTGIKRHNLT